MDKAGPEGGEADRLWPGEGLDFTYLDDAVAGGVAAVENFERARGRVFNLGMGQGVPSMEVAQEIKRLTGSSSPLVLAPTRPGEVRRFQADISLATQLLGFHPQVDIGEGLERAVAWYRSFYSAEDEPHR